MLIECTGSDAALDQQRVDKFAEYVVEQGIVVDAVLSQSDQQEKVRLLVYFVCVCVLRVERFVFKKWQSMGEMSVNGSYVDLVVSHIEYFSFCLLAVDFLCF